MQEKKTESLRKKIYMGGVVEFSTVDIPSRISAIIFLGGCNFDCPYCQNPNLISISESKLVSLERILTILEKNFLIDAVSITGGEPCIQKPLIDLCKLLKNRGYYVNVDTNGSFPKVVEKLTRIVDRFALDIKTSFKRYKEVSKAENPNIGQLVEDTYHLINNCKRVDFEVRTTVLSQLVWEKDIIKISEFLKTTNFRGTYIIQQFFNSDTVREPLRQVTPPTADKVLELGQIAISKGVKKVGIRTKEHGYQILT